MRGHGIDFDIVLQIHAVAQAKRHFRYLRRFQSFLNHLGIQTLRVFVNFNRRVDGLSRREFTFRCRQRYAVPLRWFRRVFFDRLFSGAQFFPVCGDIFATTAILRHSRSVLVVVLKHFKVRRTHDVVIV